jgi:pimeloyl-ACP methyl ester carboxylesterase
MHQIELNDYRFTYVEKGTGDPIIFVHGSVSDYRTWSKQQDEIGMFYHTIAYSRRFHWPNQKISEKEDYSMEQHVKDLEAFIRMTVNKPVHLVGHSYGAFVCLLLSMQHQNLVRTLVLSEPPVITLFVSNSPRPFEILRLLFSRPKTAAAIILFGANGLGPATAEVKRGNLDRAIEIFGKTTLGSKAYAKLSDERLAQVKDNLIKAEFIGSRYPPMDSNGIRHIKIPALLVTGQNSPRLFHLLLDRLNALIPDTKQELITGASHIMHEDNADAYNTAVISFIDKHRET